MPNALALGGGRRPGPTTAAAGCRSPRRRAARRPLPPPPARQRAVGSRGAASSPDGTRRGCRVDPALSTKLSRLRVSKRSWSVRSCSCASLGASLDDAPRTSHADHADHSCAQRAVRRHPDEPGRRGAHRSRVVASHRAVGDHLGRGLKCAALHRAAGRIATRLPLAARQPAVDDQHRDLGVERTGGRRDRGVDNEQRHLPLRAAGRSPPARPTSRWRT